MTERILDIILTDDGSHTLFVPELDETYHSRHGAVRESRHVFIENGLRFLLESRQLKEISILEIGFGTGLNVLLTEEFCRIHPGTQFELISLEPFPLPEEIIQRMNYSLQANLERKCWDLIHQSPWNFLVHLLPNFNLKKVNARLQNFESTERFDLVYFDAFAPNKQPDMWKAEVLSKVFKMMSSGAILVTYCAQGQFKRTLRDVGFEVETLPGPPGKKEMVRATK